MDSTELADRIAELVDDHWREHNAPVLLSQLGNADQGEIGRLAKSHASGLAAFVRDHMSGRVRIDTGVSNPLVMAAVPAGVEPDVDVDKLLDAHGGAPRFHPAFWAAFRVPLGEDMRRFVTTRKPIRFQDVSSNVEFRLPHYVEVERQYIDTDCETEDTQQRLADWLDANELDSAAFLGEKREKPELPQDDLLGRLVVSLDPEDMKRVSIPLDIVGKLRRQSIQRR